MGANNLQRDILVTISKIQSDLLLVNGHDEACHHLAETLASLHGELTNTTKKLTQKSIENQQQELEGCMIVFQNLSLSHVGVDSFSTLSTTSFDWRETRRSGTDEPLQARTTFDESEKTHKRSGAARKQASPSPKPPRRSSPVHPRIRSYGRRAGLGEPFSL